MFRRFIKSILIISTIRQTAFGDHPPFVIFWFSQMSFSSSIHNLCLNGFEGRCICTNKDFRELFFVVMKM